MIEYKIIDTDDTGPPREILLKKLGADNWELASVASYHKHELWIFKRHLSEEVEGDLRRIATWIWKKSRLDADDESWCGLMFEDAIEAMRNLVRTDTRGRE